MITEASEKELSIKYVYMKYITPSPYTKKFPKIGDPSYSLLYTFGQLQTFIHR
jgi:hypothetical protein